MSFLLLSIFKKKKMNPFWLIRVLNYRNDTINKKEQIVKEGSGTRGWITFDQVQNDSKNLY